MANAISTLLGYVSDFVGAFTTNATAIASWIMQTPLALLGVIAWLVVLFVGILARFIKQ